MPMQRALFVVLGAVAGYLFYSTLGTFGVAAVAVNLVTPLPMAYLGMRFTPLDAFAAVLLATLLVLLSGGTTTAFVFVVQFGVPAALLPWLLRHGQPWDRATVMVIAAMMAVSLVALLGVSVSLSESPLRVAGGLIEQEIAQTTTVMDEVLADADLDSAQAEQLKQAFVKMTDFLSDAYPGVAVTVSGVMVLALLLLLGLLGRGRYRVPGPVFADWKSPEGLVWVLIAAGFLVAFGAGTLLTIGLNLLVILLPVYFVQGAAVVECFFRRKSLSPMLRVFGYVMMTLVNPLPLVVTGIGIFDLWADFRKPREPQS
jgi:uncharacterized protein YybS (DUF2232 family)